MEGLAEKVFILGKISRISAEPAQARNGDYTFTAIELDDEANEHRTFIIFPDYCGSDFFEIPKLCWPGARVAAYNVTLNNCLKDGSRIFSVNPDSEIILEPFRPVSVVEAIESSKCLRSIDLRYRYRNHEPIWLARGKAIHSLFDRLVSNPSKSWPEIFDQTFPAVVSEFAEVLPGSSTLVNYHDFRKDLQRHHHNLFEWMLDNFRGKYHVHTELDRLSSRYGLKGRTDAVIYSGSQTTVVEVKSGKFASDDHLLQLYAYNLMIGENGQEEKINSYVVYSSTGLSRKLDGFSSVNKRSILRGRNRSVALRRHYAYGDNMCDPRAIDGCANDVKCFSRSNCESFYGSPVTPEFELHPREKLYYDTWFKLICLDEWERESDFALLLDRSTLEQRVAVGVTIPLEIVRLMPQHSNNPVQRDSFWTLNRKQSRTSASHDIKDDSWNCGSTQLSAESSNGFGDFNAGDEVIIHQGDVCSRGAMRARITEIQSGTITLSSKSDCFRIICDPDNVADMEKNFYIDKVPFLRAREMSRKNLLSFLTEANPKIVDTILNGFSDFHAGGELDSGSLIVENGGSNERLVSETQPSDSSIVPKPCLYNDDDSPPLPGFLNQTQKTAIARSLAAPIYHLVHGPPGTGKTQVLSRLIREFIRRGKRVLVTCPTNIALDRVLIALIKTGFRNFVRIGLPHNCSQEFLEMIRSTAGPSPHMGQLASGVKDFGQFRAMISGMALIGATAYQCASNPIFLKQRFDVVVIDEAGQLDEPASLAPLAVADKFILCGDHLQLPPVVRSSRANDAGPAQGLEISLFERLFVTSPPEHISSLSVQYRMNSEVQDIPSRLFYDGKLEAANEVARRRLRISGDIGKPDYLREIIDPETPVIFVDVRGGIDSGKARPEEAEVAYDIVRALTNAGVPASEIGVITPYRAQQSLVSQKISEIKGHSDISVDTVDRFQGGEREVIIMSLARSDSVTSFLADPKRLNVSLSRARSKLILLGRASVLEEHPLFNAIFSGTRKLVIHK